MAEGRRGVRRGSACVARTASNRRRQPCTRFAVLPARRTIRATQAGAVSGSFSLPFAGRRLRAGRYRLLLSAVDASGNRIGPIAVAFRVAH